MDVIGTLRTASGTITAYGSTDSVDQDWDRFLQTSPLGQYQQSSCWARYKAGEGYASFRVVLKDSAGPVAGFQVLWKDTRFGRIGYISKGPVVAAEDEALTVSSLEFVRAVTGLLNLQAIFVQPPDQSRLTFREFSVKGFSPNRILQVIDATLLVDIADEISQIDGRMSSVTRRHIRKASKSGIVVREGGRDELGRFYSLMASTCRRQATHPNPSHESMLYQLWDAFHPERAIRLTFAEHEGSIIAGLICLLFGDRATLWKKGWSTQFSNMHPNALLMHDALAWGHSRKCRIADFGSLDRDMALALMQGEELTEEQKRTRHFFNLRFGGKPALLPDEAIYISNPVFRMGFDALSAIPPAAALMRRLIN